MEGGLIEFGEIGSTNSADMPAQNCKQQANDLGRGQGVFGQMRLQAAVGLGGEPLTYSGFACKKAAFATGETGS